MNFFYVQLIQRTGVSKCRLSLQIELLKQDE